MMDHLYVSSLKFKPTLSDLASLINCGQVQVSRDVFYVDVRYTNLKPIGGGSYGFVCSADDSVSGEKVGVNC
jgi:hypothetical protein